MALSTQPYKGARDFYPADKRIQKYMFGIIRSIVEKYGYEEYDAPVLEPTELYTSKTSEEIVNEQTYSFVDRGGRNVTIRTEMTPSVSRMVAAKRQELVYPLRWYSIPNIWRYERPQRGRLREFWQLNVDLFGVEGIAADHEIIQVADAIMQAFGAKREAYAIKLNSRRFTNFVLNDYLGLNETQAATMIRLIDRMHKLDQAEFLAQIDAVFSPSQREQGLTERLLAILKGKGLDDLPAELQLEPSLQDLNELMKLLAAAGIENAEFDPALMRGFEYYTDIVFEVFDTHPDNNRAMFGGGRYDGLVGAFGVEPVATVGFGMGDVTLQNFLDLHGLLPVMPPESEVYVVLIGDVYARCVPVLKELREMGIHLSVDMTGRKPDKQLKSALKKDQHFALFIGEKELDSEQYVLKNLHTGVEEKHGTHRLVSVIKDYRQK